MPASISVLQPFVFIHDYTSFSIPLRQLRRTGRDLARGEKLTADAAIDVVLCSDYRIRKLNRCYRKIDRATDVLSFVFNEPDLRGEIYISLQRSAIQARRYGHSYANEVCRLFIHGVLHLCGYEHDTPRARKKMERIEHGYYCFPPVK